MADIKNKLTDDDAVGQAIELLFFAYRDFVSDPDKVLADYKIGRSSLGRAHHRVIHFVGRNPGMTVAELLEILQITKQSLSRVLRQLIDEEFIEQRRGPTDARQRLLYLTDKGTAFEAELSSPQRVRFEKAFEAAGPEATRAFRDMLLSLINEDERPVVLDLIRKDR